jgi:hypothetical protein
MPKVSVGTVKKSIAAMASRLFTKHRCQQRGAPYSHFAWKQRFLLKKGIA